jgi:hypothetical protein
MRNVTTTVFTILTALIAIILVTHSNLYSQEQQENSLQKPLLSGDDKLREIENFTIDFLVDDEIKNNALHERIKTKI